jgi:hypothetical protein
MEIEDSIKIDCRVLLKKGQVAGSWKPTIEIGHGNT